LYSHCCCSAWFFSVFAKKVDSAKAAYAKGQDAEARQNYEQAFEYFKQAYDQKPKELRYRTSFERARFLAASSEVHRGQILRDAGKFDEALASSRRPWRPTLPPSSRSRNSAARSR